MNTKYRLLFAFFLAVGITNCASASDILEKDNTNFNAIASVASANNEDALKAGYAWTTAEIKNNYGDEKTETGKAYKASGKKLNIVDVALYEGEDALKKGDINKAMKKANFANEIAAAQLAQQQTNNHPQLLWK